MNYCNTCKKKLNGRQFKFCCRKCQNKSINHKHKDYACQCKRGLERKIMLVKTLGGACDKCGYKTNYAALQFHHKDPSLKLFGIDIRQCSNRSIKVLEAEAKKCRLLCANCHAELHYPNLTA